MDALNREVLAQIRATNAEPNFWLGLNQGMLEQRFAEAPVEAYTAIEPKWDLMPAAKERNDIWPEILAKSVLFESSIADFLRACRRPDHYDYAERHKQGNARRLLRVAGLWLRGDALPPPVFGMLEDGMIIKLDGHHRTAVAIFAGRSPIMLYAPVQAGRNSGFRRVS